MRAALNYFCTVRLLDFDQAAYEHYEVLLKQKIRIGTQDLRIASIVLAVNGTLVTRNQRDFVQVPGLTLED
jgi:tRNA(fMet)-specific endonuclease VapC